MRLDERRVAAQPGLQDADDERDRSRDSQGSADGAGEQAVRHALGDERLHEVAALRADCASHPHLGLPLRREHHEDHEDEHDTRCDREEPEHQEERREDVAEQLGLVNRVLLEGLDLDVARARAERVAAFRAGDVRLHAALCDRRLRDRASHVALECDADVVDQALAVGDRLHRRQTHRDADRRPRAADRRRSAGRFVLDDARDVRVVRRPAGVDGDRVAELCVEPAAQHRFDEFAHDILERLRRFRRGRIERGCHRDDLVGGRPARRGFTSSSARFLARRSGAVLGPPLAIVGIGKFQHFG